MAAAMTAAPLSAAAAGAADEAALPEEGRLTTQSVVSAEEEALSVESAIHPASLPESADVIIIGAGPTGLTLACELARRGISFLIFDVNPRPVGQSRAIMLCGKTLEIFADLGIAQAAVISGHIVRGVDTIINNKQSFDVKFGTLDTPFPFAVILDQTQTERLLIERLEEFGHKVIRPFAVWRVEIPAPAPPGPQKGNEPFLSSSFNASPSHAFGSALFATTHTFRSGLEDGVASSGAATPVLRNGTMMFPSLHIPEDRPCIVHVKALDIYGRPATPAVGQVRCRYVVGCDGERSCVRKAADIDFLPQGETTEFLLADVSATWGSPLSPERISVVQTPEGGLMCTPMPQGRWRVLCSRTAPREEAGTTAGAGTDDISESMTRLEPPDFVELQQILETLIPATVLDEVFWHASFACCARVASAFKKSNVLLLGDAAHMFPPTFGQGLNAGIQDAYNVGWKLAAVIRGASPRLLDTYEAERREAVEEEITKLSHTTLDTLLRTAGPMRCVIAAVSPSLSGLDVLGKRLATVIDQSSERYTRSPIIGPNRLSRYALIPGSHPRETSVIIVPLAPDLVAPMTESPGKLLSYIRGGQHTLLLAIHVLPPGTKARTIFGCERNEEAVRWNAACLERLTKLGRLLGEAFRGREAEIAWGGLKVIWVLCGLVDFRSPSNTIGIGHVKDHVPHRLRYFFLHGAKISVRTVLAVDYEGEIHDKYGLRLADPDGLQGHARSGAFVLLRPDGHICCNGYAGDSEAISAAFDYALTWFSD